MLPTFQDCVDVFPAPRITFNGDINRIDNPLIGVIFLSRFLPESWAPEALVQLLGTDYKFAVSFIILVVVLLVRPTGIFRGRVI